MGLTPQLRHLPPPLSLSHFFENPKWIPPRIMTIKKKVIAITCEFMHTLFRICDAAGGYVEWEKERQTLPFFAHLQNGKST
jgi:hypothetical protein